jgi:hypothetical protein
VEKVHASDISEAKPTTQLTMLPLFIRAAHPLTADQTFCEIVTLMERSPQLDTRKNLATFRGL